MSNQPKIPEGFTVLMATVDFIPVLFFSIMVSVLSLRFKSLLFFIGAFLVIAAGVLKCLWKYVIAIAKKNIPFLFYQMRILMPFGFLLILCSLIVDRSQLNKELIFQQILSFPSILCYLIGLSGMVCMMIFAKKLDSNNAKHNWIEQGTNAIAQFFILLGYSYKIVGVLKRGCCKKCA
ncbi:hypothetical protein P261_02365 [Lachnospiraceae bacterium TWA4]|nr:hypothetical protein P261_02365 [Lachnospiraceae bacterium TWA4]